MSEKNMNWEFLANKDYAFLTEDPVLGDNVILLTYGGSHAYGTNIATSDVDIRGITFNPVESLLGNTEFEQFEDRNTDTVIYGLNKMIGLLLQCNPNCIEILGAKPEHYFIISPEGQLLLDNRKIFCPEGQLKLSVGMLIASYADCRMLLQEIHTHRQKKKNISLVQSHMLWRIL